MPLPATALQTDRERFERALSAARAANDAERAAALAESTSEASADDAAAEAVAAQATITPDEVAPRESRTAERDKRREERRRAKVERVSARAETRQRRAADRVATETAKVDREAAEQTALIADMPEHTEVVAEPEAVTPVISAQEQTALIAAMPEHTEVLAAAVAPAQVPDRAPDDSIVEPPPALPRPRRRSTASEKIGVLLIGLGALGLLCSVVLAVGALLTAVEVDVDAAFAGAVSDLCDVLVGPLGGFFSFSGDNAAARNDLFARGIGSMSYLAIGLFLSSVARRRDS